MIMPTKFLKPKNMRRGLLALLLAAPLVYMFGSLFFALNGAHEGNVFGSNVEETITRYLTSSDWKQGNITTASGIESESYTNLITIGYYNVEGDEVYSHFSLTTSWQQLGFLFYDDSNTFISGTLVSYENPSSRIVVPESATKIRLRIEKGVSSITPNQLLSYELNWIITNGANNYSDYLFGQFFAKDNWVASLGEKAVNNDTGIGLPFVGDLISYIDENAMPLSDSPYGYFIWGYSSYILNVLAVYMVVSIAASLVLIPMKVVDSLEERLHE